MTEAVQIDEVSLRFGGIHALREIDLSVDKGELFALIGPNGAGKTSLLNCVSGFYRPTSGHVRLKGRDVTSTPSHRMAALGVARTFQNVDLFGQMPVVDNVLLGRHRLMRSSVAAGAVFWGRAKKEEARHREEAERVIEFLELERFRGAVLSTLPYGVQKRVGIGVALASEPEVLLLDEPGSGTTREEKEDLARFLLRIKHELGITMLWVEHDMQLVGDLADRVAVLNFGQLLAQGSPGDVLAAPEVAEAYLGHSEA